MLIAVVAVLALGLLLGRKFKVPALLATTFALVVILAALGIAADWPLPVTAFRIVALVVSFQSAFLVGLLLTSRSSGRTASRLKGDSKDGPGIMRSR